MNRSDAIKRKLRALKRAETRMRFGAETPPPGSRLVWEDHFGRSSAREGRRTAAELCSLDEEDFRRALEGYSHALYRQYCLENGFLDAAGYDPDLLTKLGLPFDADAGAIKKRFHELALKHHPDAGGDAERFMEFLDLYRKLIEKGK